MSQLVILVPGFFGFEALANIPYFVRAGEFLSSAHRQVGSACRVVQATVQPTAGLRIRSVQLAKFLLAQEVAPGDTIHLVGHSSGGLDVRMLLGDKRLVETMPELEDRMAQIKTAISIATPHFGTPMAEFAGGVTAQTLLRLVSWLAVRLLRNGRLPLGFMLQVGRLLIHLDDLVGLRGTVLDQLYDQLLTHAPKAYVDDLARHLQGVEQEQGLMRDLAPARMARRNQWLHDRRGVRYGCVLTWLPPPRLRDGWSVGKDPYALSTHAVFRVLHRMGAGADSSKLPQFTGRDEALLWQTLGSLPQAADNDAIVPTRSQLWGQLIAAFRADHFDIMGYFSGRLSSPLHLDLLASASGFDANDYERMWQKIAAFQVQTTVISR